MSSVVDGVLVKADENDIKKLNKGVPFEEVFGTDVTIIGCGAFLNCTKLKSIVIPNGVRRIEAGAFAICDLLKSVVIPPSTLTIGNSAFELCENLKYVTIDGCKYVKGKNFFSYNEINQEYFDCVRDKIGALKEELDRIYAKRVLKSLFAALSVVYESTKAPKKTIITKVNLKDLDPKHSDKPKDDKTPKLSDKPKDDKTPKLSDKPKEVKTLNADDDCIK